MPKPKPTAAARQKRFRARVRRGEICLTVAVRPELIEMLLRSGPGDRSNLAEKLVSLLVQSYIRKIS